MPESPSSMFSQSHVTQEAGADGEMSFLFGNADIQALFLHGWMFYLQG